MKHNGRSGLVVKYHDDKDRYEVSFGKDMKCVVLLHLTPSCSGRFEAAAERVSAVQWRVERHCICSGHPHSQCPAGPTQGWRGHVHGRGEETGKEERR